MTRRPPVPRPLRDGFAVQGPGFYVWQETRAEALGWERELSCGGVPSPRLAPPRGHRPHRPAPRPSETAPAR